MGEARFPRKKFSLRATGKVFFHHNTKFSEPSLTAHFLVQRCKKPSSRGYRLFVCWLHDGMSFQFLHQRRAMSESIMKLIGNEIGHAFRVLEAAEI